MPPSPRGEHLSRLPDDLVAGILSLLPPRELLAAAAGHGHPVAGFFSNRIFRFTPTEYFPLSIAADEEPAFGDRLALDLSFIPGTGSTDPGRCILDVLGSCNGLLLLWCRSIHYVCNPLTKKLVPIVQSREASPSLWVSLAFDPSKSRHYKIIALADMYSIHVYSSETRSWRMAIHSDQSAGLFQGHYLFHGVFWNGSVVWIVAHSLVRFIIEEEHVATKPMPSRKKDWICAYIGESGGHLQMIGYTKKDQITACFDVLEMQENKSEWSVLYRLDLNRVKELYPNIEWPTWDTRHHQHKIIDRLALSPIYVIRGSGKTGKHGVLIFSIPGKIMSYNMEDQEISMVKEIASPCPLEPFWYSFYAYSPSLFAV
ncbi:hypothetical protein QOZ80_1AG0014960 [Eleusine coracana subsp. coracana]|nr:hypothetical protein QOZ80_1AG0014960 [Eleusine coracana subsp. coracana]